MLHITVAHNFVRVQDNWLHTFSSSFSNIYANCLDPVENVWQSETISLLNGIQLSVLSSQECSSASAVLKNIHMY